MEDKHILALLRNNEAKGLDMLFHKYYTLLTKTALYLTGDLAVSEDLVQELFLKLWLKRHQLNNIENLKAYLIRATKNSAWDHIRQNSKKQLLQEAYFSMRFKPDYELPNDNSNNLQWIERKITEGISELPPQCRLIFSLNRFEGLTNAEIADYLNISKRTVETQISKALKVLREKLKDNPTGHIFLLILVCPILF